MIIPNIQLFFDILNEVFSDNSSILVRSFKTIKLVEKDDKKCDTLCIDGTGTIYINKAFWYEHIKNKDHAKYVLIHELMHCILSDTLKFSKDPYENALANFSMDMRINVGVTCILGRGSYYKNFFINFYKGSGLSGLLRPMSSYSPVSKYYRLYNSLYTIPSHHRLNKISKDKEVLPYAYKFKNELEIRNALKILIPKQTKELYFIPLLGNHSQDENIIPLPDDIADIFKDKLSEEISKYAGKNDILLKDLINIIRSSSTLQTKVLKDFCCSAKINEIKQMFTRKRKVTSVMPIRPSRRNLTLLASGIVPVLWDNIKEDKYNKKKNIAIYLDVSGSVMNYIPKIYGIIVNLREQIKTVFCFSNKVVISKIEDLAEGKIETTGGTDFDCVIKHAIENKINKLVVFTDGYADLDNENVREMKKHIKDIVVIFFDKKDNLKNPFTQEYNKTFYLEDLIK